MPMCTTSVYHFDRVTEQLKIIYGMNKTTSSDPFPTRLLMSHLHAIITYFKAHCKSMFDYGGFPYFFCKSCIVIPLIKKPSLDREMLTNYRPVSNLYSLSKVLKRLFRFVF